MFQPFGNKKINRSALNNYTKANVRDIFNT